MRSELVYRAVVHIQCRYQLCQVTAQATRKMHRPNCRIQDTMNDVLNLLHKSSTEAGGRSAGARQAAEGLSLKNATQRQSPHKPLNRERVLRLRSENSSPPVPATTPGEKTNPPASYLRSLQGFSEDRVGGNLR